MKAAWFSFWLRVFYGLRLRGPVTKFFRWVTGEHTAPRKELYHLPTPEAARDYVMDRFQYRQDELKLRKFNLVIPVDWVSEPEVFQARLESKEKTDGDCDDIHMWAAVMLSSMKEVTRLYLLSSGFKGGAHTTVVFQRKDGSWWHFDYNIYRLNNPNEAPLRVAERHTLPYVPIRVTFYVFETIDPLWKAVAISPAVLEVS